jgi:hypothetical protein
MITISLNNILKDQIRQIQSEIDWAIELNNFAKAQELFFEMLKLQKQLSK